MAKTDDFEAQFMQDGTPVLHRDKLVSRGMAGLLSAPALLVWAIAVFLPFANATGDRPLPAAALGIVVAALIALGLLFPVLALAFAVLRSVVTERELHVKYGLWGPTIALEEILSCRVVDYEWTKYGGWGIRRGADGSWAYVAASGPCVEIRYGMVEKKVLVGAANAARLAAEIDRARSARSSVRIAEVEAAPDADAAADADRAAEAEAEARAAEESEATESSEGSAAR